MIAPSPSTANVAALLSGSIDVDHAQQVFGGHRDKLLRGLAPPSYLMEGSNRDKLIL